MPQSLSSAVIYPVAWSLQSSGSEREDEDDEDDDEDDEGARLAREDRWGSSHSVISNSPDGRLAPCKLAPCRVAACRLAPRRSAPSRSLTDRASAMTDRLSMTNPSATARMRRAGAR